MSDRTVIILAGLAGIILAVVGVLFPVAIPMEAESPVELAHLLAERRTISFIYVASVALSSLLIAPVLLQLFIRLYPLRPGPVIAAGTLFAVALMLELVTVLMSLSRWRWAVPAAANGDPTGAALLQTLEAQWLAVDLPGATLFYVAAVILAAGVWRLHRLTAWLLAAGVGMFVLGLPVAAVSSAASIVLTSASIVVYGFANIGMGRLTVQLNGRPKQNG